MLKMLGRDAVGNAGKLSQREILELVLIRQFDIRLSTFILAFYSSGRDFMLHFV